MPALKPQPPPRDLATKSNRGTQPGLNLEALTTAGVLRRFLRPAQLLCSWQKQEPKKGLRLQSGVEATCRTLQLSNTLAPASFDKACNGSSEGRYLYPPAQYSKERSPKSTLSLTMKNVTAMVGADESRRAVLAPSPFPQSHRQAPRKRPCWARPIRPCSFPRPPHTHTTTHGTSSLPAGSFQGTAGHLAASSLRLANDHFVTILKEVPSPAERTTAREAVAKAELAGERIPKTFSRSSTS